MSPDGAVRGWLRDSAAARPCHVQILHRGHVVAAAVARDFRPDLLRAGHGHGHHGFAARLRWALPEGACGLVLHLPASDLRAAATVTVPALQPPNRLPVEALLRSPPGWVAADLIAWPDCLDMQAAHAAMGTPSFVDGLFQFALARWPTGPEAALHAADLDRGRATPRGLLLEFLGGRERADMAPGLASPYDPDFPFPPVTR